MDFSVAKTFILPYKMYMKTTALPTTQLSEPMRSARLACSSVELYPSKTYSVSFTPKSHIVGFAFDTQYGVHAIGSDKQENFRRQANSFAFIPMGCDVFSESEYGGEYLILNIAPELLSFINCTQPISQFITSKSIYIARDIRRQLMMGGEIEPLLIEELIDDLWPQLVMPKKNYHCLLTIKQLKSIEEFIDVNIAQSLSVVGMAKIVNLSAGHFSRVFKQSVGVSPFDYVIQKRLTYARQCLLATDDDISTVAFASGFSSHAHMTMVFRKHLGVTPAILRKNKFVKLIA